MVRTCWCWCIALFCWNCSHVGPIPFLAKSDYLPPQSSFNINCDLNPVSFKAHRIRVGFRVLSSGLLIVHVVVVRPKRLSYVGNCVLFVFQSHYQSGLVLSKCDSCFSIGVHWMARLTMSVALGVATNTSTCTRKWPTRSLSTYSLRRLEGVTAARFLPDVASPCTVASFSDFSPTRIRQKASSFTALTSSSKKVHTLFLHNPYSPTDFA